MTECDQISGLQCDQIELFLKGLLKDQIDQFDTGDRIEIVCLIDGLRIVLD